MRHATSLTFVLALLGCGAATRAPAAPPQARIDPNLAGIWHSCAAVGGGYCERIVLAPDGSFEARASQSACDRTVSRRGTWRVEGDTLVVREAARTEHVGGQCERTDTGPSWQGDQTRTIAHATPRVESLPLGACAAAERDESAADCRRFGATTRWRLATDESMTAQTTAPTSAERPAASATFLDERAATERVMALPEVTEFQTRVEAAHYSIGSDVVQETSPACTDQGERCRWKIRVFESRPERNTNWREFEVDPRTGAIRVMDPMTGEFVPLEASRRADAGARR